MIAPARGQNRFAYYAAVNASLLNGAAAIFEATDAGETTPATDPSSPS